MPPVTLRSFFRMLIFMLGLFFTLFNKGVANSILSVTSLKGFDDNRSFTSLMNEFYIYQIIVIFLGISIMGFSVVNFFVNKKLQNMDEALRSSFLDKAYARTTIIIKRVCILILITCCISALIYILLVPENLFFTSSDPKKAIEIQIIFSVALAGFLGAVIRELNTYLSFNLELRLSKFIISAFLGVFISLVSFFLFRAGILKNTNVDTFNIYGVTGISCVTGFFSDKITTRLAGLYEALIEGSSKKTD